MLPDDRGVLHLPGGGADKKQIKGARYLASVSASQFWAAAVKEPGEKVVDLIAAFAYHFRATAVGDGARINVVDDSHFAAQPSRLDESGITSEATI